MYTIKAFRIEDFKNIREAELTDCDSVVLIGGLNGSGKSNVMGLLAAACGFQWPDLSDLIRDGQERGQQTTSFVDGKEEFLVTMKAWRAKSRETGEFTGKVNTSCTITMGEGDDKTQILKGRTWLKKRLAGKHFDVLDLVDQFKTPEGQRAVAERLRKIAGLDFSELDEEIASIAERRKDSNKDLSRAEAARDEIPEDADCPEAVVVADLVETLTSQQRLNTEREQKIAAATRAHERVQTGHETAGAGLVADQQSYEAGIKEAEELLASLKGKRDDVAGEIQAEYDEYCREIEASRESVAQAEALEVEDTSAVEEQIANAETVNARVRNQADRKTRVEQVTAAAKKRAEADRQIGELADEKKTTLAAADLGVPGLSFADDLKTILWNDEPLRRLSDGEQFSVFVELHAAQNPTINVLFSRRGSLLDAKHLADCGRRAAEKGMQLFIEVVGEREEAVHMVATDDGSVLRAATKD